MNARRHLMLVLLAATSVAGCATETTRLDAQWVNPQFAGQRAVRSLMVMGVSRDASTRRLYEDRMVASLGAAGVPAVQAYLTLPDDGPIPEDRLQRAVREADVSHVIVSRIVNITQQVNVTPGTVTTTAWGPGPGWGSGSAWGPGWRGFHGHHNSMWGPTMISTPPRITTSQDVNADTRLFDSRDAEVLWAASTTTSLGTTSATLPQVIDQFVGLIVATLKRDGVI
jgi:hypothetical protein